MTHRQTLTAILVAALLAPGCSRRIDEKLPPDEQPYRHCMRANFFGYDAAGERQWIRGDEVATQMACLCASANDRDRYDVLDAVTSALTENCTQRAAAQGMTDDNCVEAAEAQRETRNMGAEGTCEVSDFPLND